MTLNKKLKYDQELQKFDDKIQLDDFTASTRLGCRWVFEPISDDRNFVPLYAKKGYSNVMETCVGFALSMFDTETQATDRLEELIKGKRNIFKKLGTHVSSGKIEDSHGISNGSNSIGHFSFFEYEDTDFSLSFVINKQIVYD